MDVAAGNPYQKVVQANQSEQLILEHLHYVRHILGRTIGELPDGCDLENLQSAGVLGLVEAAAQFDSSRGVAFTTFSYPRIRGAILDELRRNCPLPRRMLKRWEVIREAYAHLDAPVSPEVLAQSTNMEVEEVLECLESIRLTNPDSWHEELDQYQTTSGEDDAPHAAMVRDEEWRLLADSIEQLPRQEREVLTLYHMEDLRLKEIGEVLTLSESRISRILMSAELRLKEAVRRRAVHEGQPSSSRKVYKHDKHTNEGHSAARKSHLASGRSANSYGPGADRRVGVRDE